MARPPDNPLETPVVGTELLWSSVADGSSDITIRASSLVPYVMANGSLAVGSSKGLMAGEQAEKLDDLRTLAEDDAINDQLGQIPFPIFIGQADDTVVTLYRNVLGNDVVLDYFYAACGSGQKTVGILIDGVPVTGMTGIPVGTADATATATAAKTIIPGAKLELQLSNGSSALNLYVTLKGRLTLT